MFIIMRHGNTFEAGDIPRRIGARTDLPLTKAGLDQARALGTHFANDGIVFDRVLVSPLRRTRQSAQAVLESHGSPVTIETAEWLREIDHGPDENMPEDAVVARIGAAALTDWDSAAISPAGWHVEADMRLAAWRSLFATPLFGTTLIVTSNGAARFALLADEALKLASFGLSGLKLPTGSYGVIRRAPNGRLEVPVWGRRP